MGRGPRRPVAHVVRPSADVGLGLHDGGAQQPDGDGDVGEAGTFQRPGHAAGGQLPLRRRQPRRARDAHALRAVERHGRSAHPRPHLSDFADKPAAGRMTKAQFLDIVANPE
eukprot:1868202-Prymnesium_polylepis.1